MNTTSSSASNLHLLSRNPIFTHEKNVWGYEILAMSSLATDTPPDPEMNNITARIISGDFIGLNTILARNKKLVLSYTWSQLFNQIPYAFPSQSSVILLSCDCQQDILLQPVLEQFVRDGHTLALEWNPQLSPISFALPLASVLCVSGMDDVENQQLRDLLSAGKVGLARRVASREEFEHLTELGFTLFQGRYFKTAEIIPGKKLSSHQNSRLQLMRLIESEAPNLDQLAQTIQLDVTLSYRLLTYLNSPTFGFARKIDSIRQAITLLGWINVRNWLRAVLMADIAQGEQQTELLHLSLQRGRFLEQMVTHYDYWDFKPDEMFLLGIFSLLDALLGIPMDDALAFLPLTQAQKVALTGQGGSEYMPLLSVMSAFEEEDGHALTRALLDLSLDPEGTRRMHYEAGAWASGVLATGKGL